MKVIVSLTTWKPRICNIPAVLDSIFSQTRKPDLVVLNLDREESVPEEIRKYLDEHDVEVNLMDNTRVYKKLLPTLRKYPEDCVISIDDDWIYPEGMIEDFMTVHEKYPDSPISGNRVIVDGLNCHCGCASLTKAEYFGKWLDCIDDGVIKACPSDDMVFTFFIAKNGRRYVHTAGLYYENLPPLSPQNSYSDSLFNPIDDSLEYLNLRFGPVGQKKLFVNLNLEHNGQVPYFVNVLRNVSDCEWRLTVTYTDGIADMDMIRLFRPDTLFVRLEPGEDALEKFRILAGQNMDCDCTMRLTTVAPESYKALNYLKLDGSTLRKAITEAIIGSRERFRRALDILDGDVDIVCASEGFQYYSRWSAKVGYYCPFQTFLCKNGTDIMALTKKKPQKYLKMKLLNGSRHLGWRKFTHNLFSVDRYGLERKKYVFIFGMRFRV